VDGKAVVEYLRALVTTDAIAEYIPDDSKGRSSGLSRLVCSRSRMLNLSSKLFQTCPINVFEHASGKYNVANERDHFQNRIGCIAKFSNC